MTSRSSSIKEPHIVEVDLDAKPSVDYEAHEEVVDDYITETRPAWKVPHFRWMIFFTAVLAMTATNSGYDSSMLNGLQSLERWQEKMGHPEGQKLGALSNGVLFGSIAVVPVAPYFADMLGRKKAIYIGHIIVIVGAILQGVCTNYGFFLGSRIVIGFGGGIASVASPSLISEISFPLHREAATFCYNCCWYLGAILAAWITYGTRDKHSHASWRIPSYLQALFPALQLCLLWMVPESPRYYASKGRFDEARKVLTKYHIGNLTSETDQRLVDFEMKEIEAGVDLESGFSNKAYLDFIFKKSFRKRFFLVAMVAVMTQLSGNALVSFYLVKVLISIGITLTKRQLQINGCLMIYNFVLCIAFATLVKRLKRRTMFIMSCVGMLVCYVIWTALSAQNQIKHFENKGLANGVLAMIFLYYLCYDFGLNGLPFLYITEILPYSHRAKGINLFQFISLATLIYNGYVNPIAMKAIEWKYYIVFDCIIAVELVIVVLFFPETSGYTLEEVNKVFGDEPPELNHANVETHSVHTAQSTPSKRKPSLEHKEFV